MVTQSSITHHRHRPTTHHPSLSESRKLDQVKPYAEGLRCSPYVKTQFFFERGIHPEVAITYILGHTTDHCDHWSSAGLYALADGLVGSHYGDDEKYW